MINDDSESANEQDDDCSVPAFGVSGQFMMTSEEKARHSEDFNPRKIVALTLDDSLARLFECLTLEYSGSILLTPKWKNFRSQKLKFAEKTRINNAIWRSWHIQFQMGECPLFCQFDNPLTEMAKPPKPVTLMVEGKYWKRKLEVVAAEYQKWRVFYKQMVEDKFQDVELQHQTEQILRLDQEISDQLRERERERRYNAGLKNTSNKSYQSTSSPLSYVVSQALEMVDSCNLMESMVFSLPDTLFTSLEDGNQRTAEWSSGTFKDTADTVQPTLDTLQPSLEAMTPVLDDLIEQLEASMKGTDVNWDFGSFDKNIDLPMGLNHSAATQETMDHSGHYSEPYAAVGSLPSVITTSSWPVQTRSMPPQASFGGNLHGRPETAAPHPVWTSTSGIQPGVLGVQGMSAEMPGLFGQGNMTRQTSSASTSGSVFDLVGSHAPSLATTSYPASASAGRKYASAAGSPGRIPRNSSDSLLYTLPDSEDQLPSSPSRRCAQASIPVEVQAPNLVAQLKLAKPRHPLVEEKAKRPRLPRNRSAPGLASLEASAQLKKAPQAGGVSKRQGRLPRNRSDSSLASLLRQSEQNVSRQRRGSESSDTSTAAGSPTAGSRMAHVFTKQESPLREAVAQRGAMVFGAGSSATSVGGGGDATPNMVHELVSELMSKGVSMEEIVGKLTTLGTAAVSSSSDEQVQLRVQQATPLRNTVPIVCQVAQAVPQSSFPRTVFTSPFTSTTTITSPATLPKQNDPPKGPPSSRSRRKPQTPRPSLKSMRTESSPALTEDSGLRSTDDIIQNILNENQLEFQRKVPTTPTGARITTIDPSCIRESTTAGAISRWESPESASMFKFDATVGDSTARRAMTSPVMTSPAMTSLAQTHHVTFPAVYQSISGEVMLQDATEVKQFPGLRSPGGTNSAFSSSMLMSSPPAMTMTVSQVPPSFRAIEPNKMEGATTSVFEENYKAETEGTGRSRPLTKTLPKKEYMEHRRKVHVSAEQKRRGNIKMGFDQLIEMVPALASQRNNKISKAAILRQSVDYILETQRGKDSMKEERDNLKKEIENLNSEISVCQQQLPETGVMVNRQDFNEMDLLFNHYIRLRAEQNPKFWIFSVIMRPLFEAYSSTVTTTSTEDFCRTVLAWLNQSCSLPKLRPSVLSSLRELSKTTNILTDPSQLPEQARLAASALDQRSIAESRLR